MKCVCLPQNFHSYMMYTGYLQSGSMFEKLNWFGHCGYNAYIIVVICHPQTYKETDTQHQHTCKHTDGAFNFKTHFCSLLRYPSTGLY